MKEPKGRMDGQHVGDINLDTNIPLDVKRKNEREVRLCEERSDELGVQYLWP